MSSWPGRFAAAFRFLTIIPLPGKSGTTEEELAGATPFFPLVGLVLGTIALAIVSLLQMFFLPVVSAVLTTLVLLAFSGGLHLDGLADTADGFFSARPKEQILAIMHDSATGAMGVIALVMLLLLKTACLATLSASLLPVVFLMPLAGRTAILLMMAILPYARPEGGLASIFYSRQAKIIAIWGLVFFTGICWLVAGFLGLSAVLAVGLLVAGFAWFCRARIDGATGDTLGATCEMAEAVVALVFAASLGGLS